MLKKFLHFRGLFVMTVACCLLFAGGISAHARVVSEVEPNDDMASAEYMRANRETPEDALSATKTGQYVVQGTTSLKDEDWFKVNLSGGMQYITCNDENFYFEIYDPYQMLFMSQTYSKTGYGPKPFPIYLPYGGDYYVKVKGLSSSSTGYLLAVGGPTYLTANCEVKLGSVEMAGRDVTIPFSIGREVVLPEESAVHSILMRNVSSANAKSVTVRNVNTDTNLFLRSYTWDMDGIVSLKMPINSKWEVKFGYKKNVIFNPSIKLYYAYPVTSRVYGDMVVNL